MRVPEDVIAGILQRLPVVCHLRFASVCKAWYALLSDPAFIYKNLTRIDCDHRQVLINDYNPLDRQNDFSHISLDCKTDLAIPDMSHWPHCLTIVGSYNGLVCLTDHIGLILVWNPLTQQTKVLPKSPNYTDDEWFHPVYGFVAFEVGFCFDATAIDYKVIKIFHLHCEWEGKYARGDTNSVFLYSFSTDHWKKLDVSLGVGAIPEFVYSQQMIRTPISSDEKFYHWVADPGRVLGQYQEDFSYVILSFDMELELFKTTEIPYTVNYSRKDLDIGFFMLKKHVAASAAPSGEAPIFEISVLVTADVRESWIKLIRIGPIIDRERILNPWRDGKLFVKTCEGEVKLWDPFMGEVFIVSSNGRTCLPFIELITYKASHQAIP